MYIYEPKLPSSHFRRKEQPITSRLAQRNSYYPDRVVSGFLGRGGSGSTYVWANEGLGQLSTDTSLRTHLSETGQLGDNFTPTPGKFAVFNLPKAAAKVPNDRALLTELGKIKTNEARALVRAFSSFGKPKQFTETLLTALKAMPLPGEGLKRYEIYTSHGHN